MEMMEGEVARLRLELGGVFGTTEACVTADNIWRLSTENMQSSFARSTATHMVQLMCAGSKHKGYLPNRKLVWAQTAINLFPGSSVLEWRGQDRQEFSSGRRIVRN